MKELFDALCNVCGSENVRMNEPMSIHTTFKIGGAAKLFVTPTSQEEICEVFRIVKFYKVPYFILGNGSNLLVNDSGYEGVVINIYKKHSNIMVKGSTITAEAGALLARVGKEALNHSLTGFEELTGIPGCVGGAVAMNAGAYGGEIKDCLKEIKALDSDGNVRVIPAQQLELSYRNSIVFREHLIILEAVFELKEGDKDKIEARIKELAQMRKDKQPLEYPSAGSTFKRPEGYFAGKLIQDAGLKGYSVGDAQVSEKHSGFVINTGNATAKDFMNLINYVKATVYEKYKVELELEVRLLGF